MSHNIMVAILTLTSGEPEEVGSALFTFNSHLDLCHCGGTAYLLPISSFHLSEELIITEDLPWSQAIAHGYCFFTIVVVFHR